MLELVFVKNSDAFLRYDMQRHYTQPKGFVGRNICFLIYYDGVRYGSIVAGSSLMHLPGRDEFFNLRYKDEVQQIINCVFYHMEKQNGRYPVRNFSEKVLSQFRKQSQELWSRFYGEGVLGFETLVQLPLTGEAFRRDGWQEVGITKGFTCKRLGGNGTDSYGGRRVWDKVNLKPKRVLVRR